MHTFTLQPPAPRHLCTDCGVSRMSDASACASACQFILPDYPAREVQVHARTRRPAPSDEAFFGPYLQMLRATLSPPRANAQWTGIATRIGERLLETRQVDAVLTVAPDPADRWRPVPVLVTDAREMQKVRGMRMGYAPLLALLEPARKLGIRKLCIIGIPCQVYALRSIQQSLGFERIDVVGTPCSDNTHTENFHVFLKLLSDTPEAINYLEFRTDFHVEIRFDDGRKTAIPFLKLPLSKLPADFFPLTCKTCVDYSNALADITVGYMGGAGSQWLIVRNERGAELLALLQDELRTEPLVDRGKRRSSVRGFLANVERAAGGLPLRRMPSWLRPIMGWLMPRIGPRGLEFARARIEMKAIESVLHLRHAAKQRMKSMIPAHVWALVAPYGLTPQEKERE